jgi:hypothetical protein
MAAAGLWSTSADLARFAIGLQNALAGKSRLLSEATAPEMVTPLRDGYGLGLGVQGSGPTLRFSHGGSDEGFESFFVAYARTGSGAVVMTNGQQGSPLAMEIVRAIARAYRWPDLQPRERTIASVDPAVYDTYVGTYETVGISPPGRSSERTPVWAAFCYPNRSDCGSQKSPESPSPAKIWRILAGCGRREVACRRVAYHAVASSHSWSMRTRGLSGYP